MFRAILALTFSFLFLTTCQRKQYICPAYNTYFIHDDLERDRIFMPFKIDSLGEENKTTNNRVTTDSTVISYNPDNYTTNKFQPKKDDAKEAKKYLPNGLVVNLQGKKKMRNVTDIEMKIIMIKPQSQYSNIDSSSIMKKEKELDMTLPSDSL